LARLSRVFVAMINAPSQTSIQAEHTDSLPEEPPTQLPAELSHVF